MNNLLKRFQAWRSLRQLRSLERWEQIRVKGRARFVLLTALTYAVTAIGMIDLLNHLLQDGTPDSDFSIFNISIPLTGIFIGFDSWSQMEAKYKNARIEARVKAAPSDALPPHNSPLRITPDSEASE